MPRVSGSPGCLAAIFHLLSKKSDKTQTKIEQYRVRYRVRDDFLSPGELMFYRVLATIVADRAIICPKVGLWDIFYVSGGHNSFGAKARIDRKHVDFLLCHPQTMRPLVGIELDDSSHQREDRKQRDALVEQVFATAQFPLVRIPVQRSYNTTSLADLLSPYWAAQDSQTAIQRPTTRLTAGVDAGQPPLCPKCGTPMVIRTAQRGSHKGQQFYACPNYPKCQTIIPLEKLGG